MPPPPILTGWLTRLREFCDGFRGGFCSRWPPHIWLFSWRGIFCKYLQVWKSCLDIFVSPSLVCLNYLWVISLSSVCLNYSWIVRILFSCELVRIEFALLVISDFGLGSKLLCLFTFLFYFLVRFRFSQTPCPFFSCFVSRGRRAISFLVLFALIQFVGTWSFLREPCCRMFFSFGLSNAYWCGPRQSHMDG